MRPPISSNHHGTSSGTSKNSTGEDDDIQIIDTVINANGISSRQPRGRPAGSKNNPKPGPIIIKRENHPTALSSAVLEIASGADIMDAVATLAKRRQRGISILSGTGVVTNLTLRQYAGTSVVNYDGEFEILCLSGAFMPPPSPAEANGMAAFLAGEQGQIVGGRVTGELVAFGTVTVIAAMFANVALERLPLVDEVAAAQQDKIEGMNNPGSEQKSQDGSTVLEMDIWSSTIMNELMEADPLNLMI